MKKRLVALVLCLVTLLGCTVARAEDDSAYFISTYLSLFSLSEEDCRYSGTNRAIIAMLASAEYNSKVDGSFMQDFAQPIYVSAFTSDSGALIIVDLFSEDGNHVTLYSFENTVISYTCDRVTPSSVETLRTFTCKWSYSLSLSEISIAIDTITEKLT
ncbi:MAG: hypothetical protein Q4B32_08085 [Clostridia bacterium]|nr:hypothetical protein [Clostridia bacterium]